MLGQKKYVQIVSDVEKRSVKVLNPETGEPIPGVISVKWECGGPDGKNVLNLATIQLYAKVDVKAALDVLPEAWPTSAEKQHKSVNQICVEVKGDLSPLRVSLEKAVAILREAADKLN